MSEVEWLGLILEIKVKLVAVPATLEIVETVTIRPLISTTVAQEGKAASETNMPISILSASACDATVILSSEVAQVQLVKIIEDSSCSTKSPAEL